MARDLERLVLRLEANTKDLKTKLAEAERTSVTSSGRISGAFERASTSLAGLNARVPVLAAGAAALAGTAALGAAVKRTIDFADEIGKTADRVGITTDALQEYRFAADLAGVSLANLDTGMEAFSKRLGELRIGTGALQTFLEKMDPALRDSVASARTVDEALQLILKAMDGLENQADRTALSAAAFGRAAGVDMANLVRSGFQELERARAQARSLGIVMDEALIRKAEDAKDQLTILSTVVSAKVNIALAELIPLASDIATAFLEGAQAVAAFVDSMKDIPDKTTSGLMGEISRVEEDLIALEDRRRQGGHKLITDSLDRQIAEREQVLAKLLAELQKREGEAARKSAADQVGGPQGSLGGLDVAGVLDVRKEALKARNQAKTILEKTRDDLLRVKGEEVKIIQRRYEKELEAIEKSALLATEKEEAKKNAFETAQREMLEVIKQNFEEQKQEFDDLEQKAWEKSAGIRDAFRQASSGAAQSLAHLLVTGENTFQSLGSLAENFLARILESQLNPLADAAGAGLNALFTSFFAAEKGAAIGGGRVLPFAQGGVVSSPVTFPLRGGTGLAGEAGAEGILPLARMAGGDLGVQAVIPSQSINLTVINNGEAAQATATSRTSPGGGLDIELMLSKAVASNIDNGGVVFQSIRNITGAGVLPTRR